MIYAKTEIRKGMVGWLVGENIPQITCLQLAKHVDEEIWYIGKRLFGQQQEQVDQSA
jgi:hypothetical protein